MRREDAARLFGIAPDTFKAWCRQGRVRFGKAVAKPGRGWCKIYPVVELERVRAQMAAERGRMPDGLVGRDDAARVFNLTASGWKKWRHLARVPAGKWVQVPGLRSAVKAYPLDALLRLRDELQRAGELRPDDDARAAAKDLGPG